MMLRLFCAGCCVLLATAACANSVFTPTAGDRQSRSLPSGSPHVGLVAVPHREPVMAVGPRWSCPRALGADVDVRNTRPTPSTALMPGAAPVSGTVCRYGPLTQRARLGAPTHLDRQAATALAGAVSRLRLGIVTDAVSCPADSGTTSLLAFRYPSGPPFVVWYADTGCQTLDNGRVEAGQIANASFGQFQAVLSRLAPAPNS